MGTLDFKYEGGYSRRFINEILLPQWRNRPVLRALAKTLGAVVQWAEDLMFDILVRGLLQNAVGVDLVHWGQLVGELPGNFDLVDDADEYRVFIRARILANRSTGSAPELLRIFQLITEPATQIKQHLLLPAGTVFVVIHDTEYGATMRARIRAIMQTANLGGRTLVLIEALPGYLGHASDPNIASGLALGHNDGLHARLI